MPDTGVGGNFGQSYGEMNHDNGELVGAMTMRPGIYATTNRMQRGADVAAAAHAQHLAEKYPNLSNRAWGPEMAKMKKQ